MTDRELMQQALVALGAMQSYAAAEKKGLRICDEAIEALRARLAQPDLITPADVKQLARIEKLVEDVDPYTAPPQREWQNAALRVGEELSSVGPDWYYKMSATEWLDWALKQNPRGKTSLPQEEQELVAWSRVNMNDHKEGDLGIGTVKWDASAPLVVHPHPAFQATQPQPSEAEVCCQDFEKCVRSCTPRGQWIAHVRCGCGDQIMPDDGAECGTCVTARNAVKSEWQGLTEEEIKHLWYEACQTNLELTSQLIVHLAKNIEAKLKEMNT